MTNTIKGVVSLGASLLRPTRGLIAVGHRKQPKKTLVLYEAEYCPYCRYVREALTALDLDALIYPIPKKGSRFKEQLIATGGKAQVPFLVDPNTGAKLHESEAIVKHLYQEYGPKDAKIPTLGIKSSLNATLLRGGKGMFAKPGTTPKKPLELYSFEASPYARLVRETLCELELPFLLHNVGKAPGKLGEWLPPELRHKRGYTPETRNRKLLAERGGKVMIPYLVDPNTKTAMYESGDIQRYLRTTYGPNN
jgi:glutathione S-transferase